jgi:hypothetical protein
MWKLLRKTICLGMGKSTIAAAGVRRQAIGVSSRPAALKRTFRRRVVLTPITESYDTAHLGNDAAMT